MERGEMNELLTLAVKGGAADIHLRVGAPPAARVNGRLEALDRPALTIESMNSVAALLTRDHQMSGQIHNVRELSLSYEVVQLGRFRVLLYRQRGAFGAVLHFIPPKPPSIRGLELPVVLEELAEQPQGLILCTSVPGGGRSTTMAAMLEHMNSKLSRHIVTVEDPVEFLFEDGQSRVTQREVGSDTESAASALGVVLRLDPDALMVGDVDDLDVLELLLQTAQSGITVIASLRTPSVLKSIDALLQLYAPEDRAMACRRLSRVVKAVCSQHLLPRADGNGRVAVVEICRSSPRFAEWLATGGKGSLREVLEADRESLQTQSIAQHLQELVASGTVTTDAAETFRFTIENA